MDESKRKLKKGKHIKIIVHLMHFIFFYDVFDILRFSDCVWLLSILKPFHLHRPEKKMLSNSVDPHLTAGTSHLIWNYTVCLFLFHFFTALFDILFPILVYATSLTEIMDTFSFIDGSVHFRNSGVKWLTKRKADKRQKREFMKINI